MIRIGASGYNHREWIGSFYPVGMGPARYLGRYSDEMNVCELPLSSYRLPRPADADRILGESGGRLFFTALAPVRLVDAIRAAGVADLPAVGAGFLLGEDSHEIAGRDFALKTPRRAGLPGRDRSAKARVGEEERRTAARSSQSGGASQARGIASRQDRRGRAGLPSPPARSVSASVALDRLLVRVREALAPYAKAERFGGLVLPLPAALGPTEEMLAAIARVHDRLEGLPLLIEPREASWGDAKVLEFLRGVGLGFVLADGPGPEGPSFGPDRGRPRPLPARQHVSFVPLTADTAYVRFQGRDGQASIARRARERAEAERADRSGLGRAGGDDDLLGETPRNGHGRLRYPTRVTATARRQSSSSSGMESRSGEDRRGDARERGGLHPAIRRHGSGSVGFPAPASSYFYSWEELVGWLPTLRALAGRAKDLYIVFDNPGRGSAIENARMLGRLLGTVQPEGKATGS